MTFPVYVMVMVASSELSLLASVFPCTSCKMYGERDLLTSMHTNTHTCKCRGPQSAVLLWQKHGEGKRVRHGEGSKRKQCEQQRPSNARTSTDSSQSFYSFFIEGESQHTPQTQIIFMASLAAGVLYEPAAVLAVKKKTAAVLVVVAAAVAVAVCGGACWYVVAGHAGTAALTGDLRQL